MGSTIRRIGLLPLSFQRQLGTQAPPRHMQKKFSDSDAVALPAPA